MLNLFQPNLAMPAKLATGVIVMALTLCGCAILPGYGPAKMVVEGHSSDDVVDTDETVPPDRYVIVKMDAIALEKVNRFHEASFPTGLTSTLRRTHGLKIGVGDTLVVNVWEAAGDGLFSTAERKQTSLQVVVDEDGTIYIPFAGHIKATGKSVEALRQAIEKGLTGKAVEPQVQVVVATNISNSIAVVGDVNKPGQYPLPVRGLHLMEAIAHAGGTRDATYETVVTVTRGTNKGTLRLDEIVNQPVNNIWLAPGDTVLALHRPRTYSAFGAVRDSRLVPFKTETVTLAEALAQVGGLQDRTADAGGMFLFRMEDPDLARWLVKTGQATGTIATGKAGKVPVIYQLSMKEGPALFLASAFMMRDKDVIYVANHPTAELGKFLSTIVSPLVGAAARMEAVGSL